MLKRGSPPWLAGALLLTAACSPDAVTAPDPARMEAASAEAAELDPAPLALLADAERVGAIGGTLTDFRARVLPALGRDGAGLAAATAALDAALPSGDARAVAEALAAVTRTAAALGEAHPEYAAELGVLALTVELSASALPEALRAGALLDDRR